MAALLCQISASRLLCPSPFNENPIPRPQLRFCTLLNGRKEIRRMIHALSQNGSDSSYNLNRVTSSSMGDIQRCKSNLESLFCYDKPIPEEIIEKPVGLSFGERNIGGNPRCIDCQAKGAVLCKTCSGSGLYIDSILESQGIIVKVRCLGKAELENGKRMLCSYCYPGFRKLKRSTGEVVKYFGKLVPLGGKNKGEETVAWSLRNAPSGLLTLFTTMEVP